MKTTRSVRDRTLPPAPTTVDAATWLSNHLSRGDNDVELARAMPGQLRRGADVSPGLDLEFMSLVP